MAEIPARQFEHEAESAAKENPCFPKVVSVWPEDGAVEIEPVTELRIWFDQPMEPLKMRLTWEKGQCRRYRCMRYDEKKYEFTIGVEFEPGSSQKIFIGREKYRKRGFRGAKEQTEQAFSWSFKVKGLTPSDTVKPKVESVSPAGGAQTAMVFELKVSFDQPMLPDQFNIAVIPKDKTKDPLGLRSGGAFYDHISYNSNLRQFCIPLALPAGQNCSVELSGFVSAKGVTADTVVLNYTTAEIFYSDEMLQRFEKARQTNQLKSLLEKVGDTRSKLKSLSETVHTVRNSTLPGLGELESEWAQFKMQDDRQFYGDVSQAVDLLLYAGSDGKRCWFYSALANGQHSTMAMASFDEIEEKNVVMCDPFGLTKQAISEVLRKNNIEYVGTGMLEGRKSELVRMWPAQHSRSGTALMNLWWIDAETYMPLQLVSDHQTGSWTRRFIYTTVNQKIDDSQFKPVFAEGTEQKEPQYTTEGYDKRFMNVMDGSGGKMSVRWGRSGPAGSSGSGLS